MKIRQINNDQINIKTSGIAQVISGTFISALSIIFMLFFVFGQNGSEQKLPIFAIFIFFGFFILGLLLIYKSKERTIIISKIDNITINEKHVLTGHSETQTIPISDIVAVRLITTRDNTHSDDISNSNSRRSTLSLLLANSDLVELGTSSSSKGIKINGINLSSLINKTPLRDEAEQIADFLNVPLQAEDSSTLAGAVNTIKNAIMNEQATLQSISSEQRQSEQDGQNKPEIS